MVARSLAMRSVVVSCVVSGALSAGCGSAGVKTVVQTVTAPSSSASAASSTPPQPSGPPDCDAAGMNAVQLKEGTCVSSGQTLVIVNKGTPAHMKTLDATLVSTNTQNSLSDNGQSATANGQFAILTITLTNKLDTPQQWHNGQAGLELATGHNSGSSYSEDFQAENGPDQNSCLWKAGSISQGIQPGESVTCDVIFDIPASASLTSTGTTLVIGNFGENDYSHPTMPVAVLRTYH